MAVVLLEFTMMPQFGRSKVEEPVSVSAWSTTGFNTRIQLDPGPGPETARAPTVVVAMFSARRKKVGWGRLISTSTYLLLPALYPLTGGRLTVTVISFVPSVKPLAAAAARATVVTWVLVGFLFASIAPATAALSAAAVIRRR